MPELRINNPHKTMFQMRRTSFHGADDDEDDGDDMLQTVGPGSLMQRKASLSNLDEPNFDIPEPKIEGLYPDDDDEDEEADIEKVAKPSSKSKSKKKDDSSDEE